MKAPSKTQEENNIISPIQEIVEVSGDMYYCQGNRAWNTIRLKADLLKKFPQLTTREFKFGYKMIVPQSQEEIKKLMSKIQKDSDKIPVLLYFCKKEIHQQS